MDVLKSIANIRIENGFSQEYMAKELSISQNNYSKIERGFTRLTVEKMMQIADVLNVSPSKLISDPSESSGDSEAVEALEKKINEIETKYFEELKKNESLTQWLKDKESLISSLEDKTKSLKSISTDFFYNWVIYETRGDVRHSVDIVMQFLKFYIGLSGEDKGKYMTPDEYGDYDQFKKITENFIEEYPKEWDEFIEESKKVLGEDKIYTPSKIIKDNLILPFHHAYRQDLILQFFLCPAPNYFFRTYINEIEKINKDVAKIWYDFNEEYPLHYKQREPSFMIEKR